LRPEVAQLQPVAHVTRTSNSTEASQDWSSERDNEVRALLYTLAGNNAGQEFSPKYSPDLGIMYSVNGKDVPSDRMKQIAERGMLDITGAVAYVCCPECGGMRLSTALKCPTCRKQTLSKSELVIHYECGHLAPIPEIKTPGTNEYTCSNCGKKMKRVGIDYGKPGLGFKCLSCGEVSLYPLLISICECGREFKTDRSRKLVIPIYRIGRTLQAAPRISRGTAQDNLAPSL
jgi:hypothetical protein